MIAYIGLDDTDNPESRGTGHLAREIADNLSATLSRIGYHQTPAIIRSACALYRKEQQRGCDG